MRNIKKDEEKESVKTGGGRLTTATKITIVRLVLLPFILFFYISGTFITSTSFFYEYGRLIALVLFVIASLSDFLDGYIARKYNQVSDLGKLLDPIADKLLTVLGLILIVTDAEIVQGAVNPAALLPVWFAVIIIFAATARDFIVSILRQLAADRGVIYAANWSGKIKTAIQLVATCLIMFYAQDAAHNFSVFNIGTPLDVFSYVCVFLMALAVVLNVYSTIDYYVQYKKKIATRAKEK